MNILDVITNRRSIRHFKDKEIPQDLIDGKEEIVMMMR